MIHTKEIRWFFKEANPRIHDWFKSLMPCDPEIREDHYLRIDKDDISFKLREGKIEVKQRVGNRAKGCLSNKVWGCFEEYKKWSFSAENDALSAEIKRNKHEEWSAIQKQRWVAEIIDLEGKAVVNTSIPKPEYGCAIAYTKLVFLSSVWYTFALEWFGEKHITVPPELIREILGETELCPKQSIGYASFLIKQYR